MTKKGNDKPVQTIQLDWFKNKGIIKKKIKIAKQNIHERLHREPYYTHPRLKFIPNIIINIFSFLLAVAVVTSLLYIVLDYLIKKFYHLD